MLGLRKTITINRKIAFNKNIGGGGDTLKTHPSLWADNTNCDHVKGASVVSSRTNYGTSRFLVLPTGGFV